MLEDRVFLHGNTSEKINHCLCKAGWFPGRKVSISSVLDYYNKWSIELTPQVISFFQEYHGIASQWYIENTNLEHAPDFYFELFPYPKSYSLDVVDFMYEDAKYEIESDEYRNVKACSNEDAVMVGEIGYYYPARVWIGNSGTIYCTHEYEDDVRKFDSVMSLIASELENRQFDSVAMKAWPEQ